MRSIKRVASLAVTIMLIVVLYVTPTAFAAEGTLELINSEPENGSESMPIENVGIKLYFSGDVTSADVWENNKNSFVLKDSAGIEIPVYPIKGNEVGYILVIAEPKSEKENQAGQLAPKSYYTLTISGDMVDSAGNSLGEERTVDFRTIDVEGNSKISMYMMIAMVVAVIVIMMLTNYKKMKADVEAKVLEQANPYKIAKERGITVDEAKVLIEKAKEKNRKKREQAGLPATTPKPKETTSASMIEAPKKVVVYKVKGPKPISEGGSTYKTGRKALAEKKAKAEAAMKAAKASNASKGSHSKAKKGKSNKKK